MKNNNLNSRCSQNARATYCLPFSRSKEVARTYASTSLSMLNKNRIECTSPCVNSSFRSWARERVSAKSRCSHGRLRAKGYHCTIVRKDSPNKPEDQKQQFWCNRIEILQEAHGQPRNRTKEREQKINRRTLWLLGGLDGVPARPTELIA